MNIIKFILTKKFQFLLAWAFLLFFAADNARASKNLCKSGEKIVISFKIKKSMKFLSVCEGAGAGYLIYRFGMPGHIELEYPSISNKDSWSKFRYDGYYRGGGIINDGMGNQILSFSNDGASYQIFQFWRIEGDEYDIGVSVYTNDKTLTIYQGDEKTQSGSLMLLNEIPNLKNMGFE